MQILKRKQIVISVLSLGIPLIIGELGSIAQQFADTMMVGYHSTTELAASGFVNSIFYFVIFLTLGMSYASTPVIASAFGMGDMKKTTRSFLESILLNLGVGLFFVFLLTLFYFNMELFEQPHEILSFARPYLLTLMASVPFMTVFYAFKQYLDALGNTKISMIIMLIANLLNIFLNWCFIFGHCGSPNMGLFGAGLSTLISRIVQLVLIVLYVRYSQSARRHWISGMKPTFEGIRHQFSLGYPISIQLGLEIAIFNVCGIFAGWLGVHELAAHQAMFIISTLCFQVLYGIGSAGSILIGQMYGRGEWINIRRTASSAFWVGLVFVSFIITMIAVFFSPLASCFTEDEVVINMMWAILPSFVIYQFGDCLQIIYGNAIRGVEATKPLMFIAFFAYVVITMPLCYFFTFLLHWSEWGLWAGVPIGLLTAGILFFISFRKRVKLLQENQTAE